MQCSLVPRIASVRLLPVIAEQPRPGLALVAGHRGVAEIHAARPLQQVAGGRRHVAQLCRSAGEDRLRQHRIVALHGRVVGEIGVAHRGADLQPAVRRRLDLVQRQAVDVDELRAASRH